MVLEAIVEHLKCRKIYHSMETRAGKTTLLFSHVSQDHKAFSLDSGNSLSAVRNSPLLNQNMVEFYEGPSQLTLPTHRFQNKLQLAYIDGPHGYPFPELEYFRVYPHLEVNALLIIDDIHIPNLYHLFDFLKADDMFSLLDVVEYTAFFARTNTPTFPTDQDNWWEQNYNKKRFPIDFKNAECVEMLQNEIEKQYQNVLSSIEFGSGFHIDEGHFRWISDEAHLIVHAPLLKKSYNIRFQLACITSTAYPKFPFTVEILLDNEAVQQIEFASENKKIEVEVNIPASETDVDINMKSSGYFIPADGGLEDTRRLAVQFSHLSAQPIEPTFGFRSRIGR
jgi:hypothetical protein